MDGIGVAEEDREGEHLPELNPYVQEIVNLHWKCRKLESKMQQIVDYLICCDEDTPFDDIISGITDIINDSPIG